jgi:hypothetical protein
VARNESINGLKGGPTGLQRIYGSAVILPARYFLWAAGIVVVVQSSALDECWLALFGSIGLSCAASASGWGIELDFVGLCWVLLRMGGKVRRCTRAFLS